MADEPQPSADASREAEHRLNRAFALLNCSTRPWRNGECVVQWQDRSFPVRLDTLAHQVPIDIPSAEPEELAFAIAGILGLALPDRLLFDFDLARPWLRPRIVSREALRGPERAMCRRDAFGSLIKSVAIGLGPRAPFVTTRMLDHWPLEFEDVLTVAIDNLRRTIDPDLLVEIDGADGLLALLSDLVPGSSACFALDALLPDEAARGCVFTVPAMDACIMLPLVPGATVDGLAMLIQTTLTMHAESRQPISDQLFWFRGRMIEHIRVTSLDEGGERRAHLESTGLVRDLLRELGEVDGATME